MRLAAPGDGDEGITIPAIGDRVERRRAGISKYGTVHYADQIQALVKWDDGTSSSLRLDRDKIRIIEPTNGSEPRGGVRRAQTPAAESRTTASLP